MDAAILLYLRIGKPKGSVEEEFGWYCADLKEGHVSDVTLIVDEDSRIPLLQITSVFIDSYLCVLGGNRGIDYTGFTADVFSVYIKRPQEVWTMLSPVRYPRAYASAITLGGKIYVFGGGSCLGEVFDTATNSWDHLPLPDVPFPECEDLSLLWKRPRFPRCNWILIRERGLIDNIWAFSVVGMCTRFPGAIGF